MTTTTIETKQIACPNCRATITYANDPRGLLRTNKHVCGMRRRAAMTFDSPPVFGESGFSELDEEHRLERDQFPPYVFEAAGPDAEEIAAAAAAGFTLPAHCVDCGQAEDAHDDFACAAFVAERDGTAGEE
jgi:hypothetical protein